MALLGALLRPVRKKLPLPIQEVRSVLFLRYDALGDAILTTPVWKALKESNPDIHIGVAGSVRNIEFLKKSDLIDSTYIFSRALSWNVWKEIRKARKQKWDVVINLFFHDKTRGAIFAKLAAPTAPSVTMVRKDREKYEKIYSRVGVLPNRIVPMVFQNIIATQLAIDLPEEIPPTLILPKRTINTFAKKNDYIILHLEASQDYKEWGIEASLEFTKIVLDKTPLHVIWTSSHGRADRYREELLILHSDRAQFQLTPFLDDIIQLISNAKAVVTPDTSIIHIADAEQVPVVGLYLEPNEFLPQEGRSRVIFSPDGKKVSKISPEEVFRALKKLIQ